MVNFSGTMFIGLFQKKQKKNKPTKKQLKINSSEEMTEESIYRRSQFQIGLSVVRYIVSATFNNIARPIVVPIYSNPELY